MSYDLAVWVGPQPTDAAAAAAYARRMDAMEAAFESDEEPPPVAPEIEAFVEAALARWPDLDDDPDLEESPWASSPLIGDAIGDFIYFPMTFSGAEYARDVLADIAASLGLVCYDPQIEQVLPDPSATTAAEVGAEVGAAFVSYVQNRDVEQRRPGLFSRLFGRGRP